jgi:hypothetical protein
MYMRASFLSCCMGVNLRLFVGESDRYNASESKIMSKQLSGVLFLRIVAFFQRRATSKVLSCCHLSYRKV